MFFENLIKRHSDEKQLRMIIDYCRGHREFLKTRRKKSTNDLPEFTWGMISAYEDIEMLCRVELGELSMHKGDLYD